MAKQPTDLAVLGQGMAVLATCIVQELAKSDPTFEERFLRRLTEAYYELRDNSDYDPGAALGLLASTRSLITGFDHVNGQREPFLSGRLDD
jgi:hypothetical protein